MAQTDAQADKLSTLIQWVESAEDATTDARKLSERDRDYYDGRQLTSDEIKTLQKRKQPVVITNRIKRKVNLLTGLEKQQRTDPKGFPRNPMDEDAAAAATDAIRFVCDQNRFDVIRSAVWENLLIEGFGGVEVTVEFKGPLKSGTAMTRAVPDIVIKRWAWDRLGYDPHSSEPDFSDAKYVYGLVWMDIEDALAEYPDAKGALESTLASSTTDDTYDDKPKHSVWGDRTRKRVKICQIYYREARTEHWCIFTKGGKIAGGKVPFVDEDGEPERPLILASAYVDRDNARYGAVRELISPQDEANKRRSKLLHQLNVRQVKINKGGGDARKIRQELAKPDGVVELEADSGFDILNNNDQISGQAALLTQTEREMDMMGPNAALMGKGPSDQSGRAIIAQQQGGLVELATLTDRLRQWNLSVYRQIWNRVRQYWTAEKWVRVTDSENNVRFVGLNRPVTLGETYLKQLQAQGLPPEQLAQEAQIIRRDPRANQVVAVENVPARMDVDILVEDVPDTVSIQHEQFQELVTLAQAGVKFPPQVYVQASQLRNKKELVDMLSGGDNPAAAELQQAQVKLALADAQAEIGKKQASAEKDKAQAMENRADAIKTMTELRQASASVLPMRRAV